MCGGMIAGLLITRWQVNMVTVRRRVEKMARWLVSAAALLAALAASQYSAPSSAAQSPNYSIVDLGTLGSATRALGLNDRGQVVGVGNTSAGAAHAFIWEGGNLRDLGTLG